MVIRMMDYDDYEHEYASHDRGDDNNDYDNNNNKGGDDNDTYDSYNSDVKENTDCDYDDEYDDDDYTYDSHDDGNGNNDYDKAVTLTLTTMIIKPTPSQTKFKPTFAFVSTGERNVGTIWSQKRARIPLHRQTRYPGYPSQPPTYTVIPPKKTVG